MRFRALRKRRVPHSSGPLLLLVQLVLLFPAAVKGAVSCSSDSECEKLLFAGSECRNGSCSNPFEKGCLNALLNNPDTILKHQNRSNISDKQLALERRLKSLIRVCNSEDPPDAASRGICKQHNLEESNRRGPSLYSDYTEIRISAQNWESPMFMSWLLQILLSEILQVPTTVETGYPDRYMNFYDSEIRMDYGNSNDWDAMERAANAPGADCRLVDKFIPKDDEDEDAAEEGGLQYQSCAHVIAEVWNGHMGDMRQKHKEGILESPQGNGATGVQALYVPKFTAQNDSTLLSYFGIQGEENRRKLAETFLRPTSWEDYCKMVSPTNCTEPDDVAKRPPQDDSERNRMHFAGFYTGHFRSTDENNCDLNPTTCTGHVADYPCGWSSFLLPQVYHQNIALRSNGEEPISNGYSYQQLSDIWAAANETRSNVITVWWLPEALYSTYLGTDTELTKVLLTPPTQECIENRILASERCDSPTFEALVGDPKGSCDEAPQMLHKVVSNGLYAATNDPDIPEARRSPAYDTVKAFAVSELQLGQILKAWIERDVDKYGFDGRLATCQWVGDNLEFLAGFIPRSYPRLERQENIYDNAIFYPAIVLGTLATIMAIVTMALTYYWRNTQVLQFAQVEFLFLLSLGLAMVSVGSVLLAVEPTDVTCVCLSWLISLGYTLELVPLIVKVGAINKLLNAAKRMRRVKLTRLQLFGTVAAISTIVIGFLIAWTIVDPQQRSSEYDLTAGTTEYGETVVNMSYYCSSDSGMWRYVAVAWHMVLLICATVLAFQTRNIREGFNESQVLAFMIYSHFFFVVLRVITFILGDAVAESFLAELRSMIYSTDALVTISLYFIPKFLTDDAKFIASGRMSSNSNFQSTGGQSRRNSDASYFFSGNADNSMRSNSDNHDNGNADTSETKSDNGLKDDHHHRNGSMSHFLTQMNNDSDASPTMICTKDLDDDDEAAGHKANHRKNPSNGHRHQVSFADLPEHIPLPEQLPDQLSRHDVPVDC